jgi:hypothetical protein
MASAFDRLRERVLRDPALQARLRACTGWDELAAAATEVAGEPVDVAAAERPARRAWLERDLPGPLPAADQDVSLDGWVPAKVMVAAGDVRVTWVDLTGIAYEESFLLDTVQRGLRDPYRLVFVAYTGSEALEREAPDVAGLILHTSRCGSTLVSRMLGELAGVTAISEPVPLDELLRAPGIAEADRARWVAGLIAALARPGTRLVLKLDAWSIEAMPTLRAALPGVRWTFLHRDPAEVIASHLRLPGMHAIPGALPPELFGLDLARIAGMSRERYIAAVVSAIRGAAVRERDAAALFVDYAELPDAVERDIAPHFGLAVDAVARERMNALTRTDAKRPNEPFDAVQWVRERPVTGEILAAARTVVGITAPAQVRLPLSFSPEPLAADVAGIAPDEWVPHFNTREYEGDWSGVSLRSPGGRADQLYPDPAADAYADTGLMARCPALAAALGAFECELRSVRLLRLAPGAAVREHADHGLGHADGEARIHVPITTGPGVEFQHLGEHVEMAPGEAWYLDLTLPHAVANRGTGERVHLIADCVVNDWLDRQLGV